MWRESEVKSTQGNPNNNKSSKSKKKKMKKKEKKRQAATKKDDLATNKDDLESADAASRSCAGTSVNNKASSINTNNLSDANNKVISSKDCITKKNNRMASNVDEDSINHSSSVSSEGCSDNGSLILLRRADVRNNSEKQLQQKMSPGEGGMVIPLIEQEETKRIKVHAQTESLRCGGVISGMPMQLLEKDCSDPIDFVLYLQQTGSIIALSKLMDALDFD